MTDPFAVRPSQAYGGHPVGGAAIGILALRTRHPLLPGNVQHAASFDGPVLYEFVDLPAGRSLLRGDPEILPLIVAGAERLIDNGARAVVGACGSFAHFQRPVASAVRVPAFLSIMTQVPHLLACLPPHRKLCVVSAWASALTPSAYDQCGVADPHRLVVIEAAGCDQFEAMLVSSPEFDSALLNAQIVGLCQAAVRGDPSIAAILLQCSDLPPFARSISQATGLPVFDMTLMIRWLQWAFDPPDYPGRSRFPVGGRFA